MSPETARAGLCCDRPVTLHIGISGCRPRCEAVNDEKNVSAQQPEEKEDSRFPCPDEVRGRPQGSQASARQGPQAAGCLTDSRPRSFPPDVRLRKRREFLGVYEQGRRFAGSLLVLFVVPTSRGYARLGVTATRKIGGAVVRNRVRRKVRELFRACRVRLPSWDLVVNVRGRAVGTPYKALERDFQRLIGRAREELSAGEKKGGR